MAALIKPLPHGLNFIRFFNKLKKSSQCCLSTTINWNVCFFEKRHHLRYSKITSRRFYTNNPQKQDSLEDVKKLLNRELERLPTLIKQEITTDVPELYDISQYYFDGKGKSIRPMVILLIALSCNQHMNTTTQLYESQRDIAMICEMIHTASLIHDDVIDQSNLRRGKPTADSIWGQRKSILAGDYVLAVAGKMLAKLGNTDVVRIITQIIDDLVRGEFMQLNHKDNEDERFASYLRKTFRKTASLLANGCKAVAVLGDCDESTTDIAYEYGRNFGIAFQLIDDVLDFVSTDETLGKPVAADLRLGLATAPVLFASQQYPELNNLILRRFSQVGDVEKARDLVEMSDGLSQTRFLAERHSNEAAKHLSLLTDSPYRTFLLDLTKTIVTRSK